MNYIARLTVLSGLQFYIPKPSVLVRIIELANLAGPGHFFLFVFGKGNKRVWSKEGKFIKTLFVYLLL